MPSSSTSSSSQRRRPQNGRSCPGATGHQDDILMDITMAVTFEMETNRPELEQDEQDLALRLLNEDVMQSLINRHCGKRNHDRPVGSRATNSGLQSLWLRAIVPTVNGTCLQGITHEDSLSCRAYSNEISLLFDSGTTPREMKEGVAETIQKYMQYNFYINELNLDLAETGTSLHVTALNFKAAQEETPHGYVNTTNNDDEVIVPVEPNALVGSQMSANNDSKEERLNNFIAILMVAFAVSLGVLLLFLLWRQCKSAEQSGNKVSKNARNRSGSIHDTLITGEDDTLISDQSTLAAENLRDPNGPIDRQDSQSFATDGQQSRPFSPVSLAYIELGSEEKSGCTSQDRYSSTPLKNDTAPSPATMPASVHSGVRISVKCGNPHCRACIKAADNDPNYMCPKYYSSPLDTAAGDSTASGSAGNDQNRPLRFLGEESVYLDNGDDTTISQITPPVVPPSQVSQFRTHLRSMVERITSANRTLENPNNSLLDSISEGDSPRDRGGDTFSSRRQVSVRPARTMEL